MTSIDTRMTSREIRGPGPFRDDRLSQAQQDRPAVIEKGADVVLLSNNLSLFAETLRIAQRCRRIILVNFAGTLVIDGVGIILAAVGLLNPLLAAFVHVSPELVFILNSARLMPEESLR